MYYTPSASPIHNRVSRFTASTSNPDVVQAGSEVQLLNLPTLGATNHISCGSTQPMPPAAVV